MDAVYASIIGLVAGIIGGLAGIGGSMVIIPGCAIVFGYDDDAHTRLHVFMAAALCINVGVAVPATIKHARAGFIRRDLMQKLLPAMVVSMIIGVLAANSISGLWLKYLLAAFIFLYCLFTLYRIVYPRPPASADSEEPTELLPARSGILIGMLAGLVGGLLGLGGGVVMVPLLQVVGRVRLRQAVAASSAVMCISATFGAVTKLMTLESVKRHPLEALALAGLMLPGAVVGSLIGASLIQSLPVRQVRVLILIILSFVAARMAWVA